MVPIIVASRRAGSSDKDAALDADADDYVTKYMAQLRHKLEDDPSPPQVTCSPNPVWATDYT